MHTHSLGAYMKEIEKNCWDGVAQPLLSSAQKLHRAGADILICPDNTILHEFIKTLSENLHAMASHRRSGSKTSS